MARNDTNKSRSNRNGPKGTASGFAVLLDAGAAAGLKPRKSADSRVVEMAERDELAYVPHDDPDMAEAFRKARESLPRFLTLAGKPAAGMDGFAVKIAIDEGDGPEFFWVHPFIRSGNAFTGKLDNSPQTVGGVSKGQRIAFAMADIVDWMYLDKGRMRGNFTAQALLKTPEEREAFRKRFGLDYDP